ncbi:hypothetical protein COO60DRAFT_360018 [Scenedesmus sp. NREL 46B-D3]|nr:hypothetical protein COO60DRAFT_360018 [Scenedesmus sp. NREL 46B-D3]
MGLPANLSQQQAAGRPASAHIWRNRLLGKNTLRFQESERPLPASARRARRLLHGTTVSTQPQQRFDQAGLMVWISKSCWLKTSVEYGGPGRPSQLGVLSPTAATQTGAPWTSQMQCGSRCACAGRAVTTLSRHASRRSPLKQQQQQQTAAAACRSVLAAAQLTAQPANGRSCAFAT